MSEIQETEKRVVKCVREGSFWYTTRKRICAYVFRIKRCFRSLDSPSQSFDHRIRQLPIHYIIGRIKGVSLSIYFTLFLLLHPCRYYLVAMQKKMVHHMIKRTLSLYKWMHLTLCVRANSIIVCHHHHHQSIQATRHRHTRLALPFSTIIHCNPFSFFFFHSFYIPPKIIISYFIQCHLQLVFFNDSTKVKV